jgi:transposase
MMADFFLGCDVSKGYADFVLLSRGKRIIEKPFQLDDTFEGHSSMSDLLKRFFTDRPQAKLFVGVESTGGYEDNWYALMSRLSDVYDMQVARLNPLGVKKHKEASQARTVTDAVSAYHIASYLIAYPEKVVYGQDMTFNRLRKQWNLIQLLSKQRTQLINHLGFFLYQANPGLVRFCHKGIAQWVYAVIRLYPTARKLARAHAPTLAKIPYVTCEKAQELIAEAKNSVAAYGDETDEMMIRGTLRQITNLETAIENQKKALEKSCSLPEIDLLCTFKGVSSLSAVGLLINIVSVERFPTASKLVSYFGLNPAYVQSGDGAYGFHMSKKGSKQPRAILFMITMSAITCNPVIQRLYADCVDRRGMERMQAIGVCMHKILRIVYGMLKTRKPFDPAIDERNRKRRPPTSKTIKSDNRRRMQEHDKTAPISNRQNRRRKENGENREPQKSVALMNGVIPSLQLLESIIYAKKHRRSNDPQKLGDILVEAIAESVGAKR